MQALEREYEEKKRVYDTLVSANNLENSSRITTLNTEMAELLQEMLSQVATMRGNAVKLESYRDELIRKLVGVQNERTILQQQKDQYAALHKLHTHEQATFYSTFFWYGIVLAIVFVVFFFILVQKGQSAPTIPTMTTSATTMPAFM
jgi:dynactin complex subunit